MLERRFDAAGDAQGDANLSFRSQE